MGYMNSIIVVSENQESTNSSVFRLSQREKKKKKKVVKVHLQVKVPWRKKVKLSFKVVFLWSSNQVPCITDPSFGAAHKFEGSVILKISQLYSARQTHFANNLN